MPTALITGGNRGLGFETGRQLAGKGWRVALAARELGAANDAAGLIGSNAVAVELDVTDPDSVARLVHTLRTQPPLDALVNNAGVALKGFDAFVAERTLGVNYFGAARVTDALLPLLAQGATVVMVSSGMGELSSCSREIRDALLNPELSRDALDVRIDDFLRRVRRDVHDLGGWPASAYRVSKVALNALTRILARQWMGTERRVNSVCPGWVRTELGGAGAPRTVTQGAAGIVWAALGAEGNTGGFFRDGRRIEW